MYYRKPPKKSLINYIAPLAVIALIFLIIFFGWKYLNGLFVNGNRSTTNENVFLSIESGSAKAMTVGKGEWQPAPNDVKLYRGERLKTATDGRTTLTFSDQSIMRLNKSSEVGFTSLKRKNDTHNIEVELDKGEIWASVEPMSGDSSFSVTTELLTIDVIGTVFAVSAPGTVYMIEGKAQIGIKYDDEVIKTYTLGVGQQFNVDAIAIKEIEKGENREVLFALSDTFKSTNWYRWNMQKDSAIDAFETSEEDVDVIEDVDEEVTEGDGEEGFDSDDLANVGRVAYSTKPSNNAEVNKSVITVEGKYDPEKIQAIYVNGNKAKTTEDGRWGLESVRLKTEGENAIELEVEDLDGNRSNLDSLTIIYDKTPPNAPVIKEPSVKEGEDFVEIEDIEQVIEGSVDEDVQAITVNDYRLGLYIPGSEEFKYYAKTEYGNLEAGENEYKVFAEDKAGNVSEPTIIILKLDQEVIDEKAEEADEEEGDPAEIEAGATDTSSKDEDADETPAPATSSGGVKITAPNDGESFMTNETEFEIAGDVPVGTTKVTVNDYKLSLFNSGDTGFKYRAFVSIGNLKIGEKNNYIVKAFGSDNELLGEASIMIDIESGTSAAPIIILPSDTGSYSTSLDEIVISGFVGKWVTRIYINDKEITDYIPGSEKFRKTVKLEPGKKTYEVTAEKAGEPVGSASIEVTYTQ